MVPHTGEVGGLTHVPGSASQDKQALPNDGRWCWWAPDDYHLEKRWEAVGVCFGVDTWSKELSLRGLSR